MNKTLSYGNLNKIAEQMGVTQAYVSQQISGKRTVTEALRNALRELASDEPKRLRERADRIENIIAGSE